jgi:hypothetical protein
MARKPDLNIIENVWKILKLRVQRRLNEIRYFNDIKRVVRVLSLYTAYEVCMRVCQGEFDMYYEPGVT